MTANPLYTPDFETFWRSYPNRRAKLAAAKAWKKERPQLQEVLDALVWQRKQAGWLKDDGAYVPHGATWLNGRRWEDENPAAHKDNFKRMAPRQKPDDDFDLPF